MSDKYKRPASSKESALIAARKLFKENGLLRDRLAKIAEILERRDDELIASDGPIPQDPPFLREIYLLSKRRRR